LPNGGGPGGFMGGGGLLTGGSAPTKGTTKNARKTRPEREVPEIGRTKGYAGGEKKKKQGSQKKKGNKREGWEMRKLAKKNGGKNGKVGR